MADTFGSPAGGAGDDGMVDGGVVDGGVADGEVTGAAAAASAAAEADAAAADAAVAVDPLAQVTAERDEYLDSLRRMQAEFENYRKRTQKQQADEADRAARSLVEKLLPVLDVLDLAAAHLGDPGSNDATALVQATALLNDVLGKAGLERVDPVGDVFDPTLHEAVGQAPAEVPDGDAATGPASPADDGGIDPTDGERAGDGGAATADTAAVPDGPVVAQVMRAGYVWRGTVVRPAMVLVRG